MRLEQHLDPFLVTSVVMSSIETCATVTFIGSVALFLLDVLQVNNTMKRFHVMMYGWHGMVL